MTSSEKRSPTCARTASPSAGGQSTSARRGEIAYQTRSPSPSMRLAGRPHLELRQVRDVGDPDGRVLLLARDRDGDEPAVRAPRRSRRGRAARARSPRRATGWMSPWSAAASTERNARGSRLHLLAGGVVERPEVHRHRHRRGRSPGRRSGRRRPRGRSGRSRGRSPCRARRCGARSSRGPTTCRRRRPGRPRPGSRRRGSRSRRASSGGRGRRPAASPTCRPTRTPCRS